MEDEKKRAQEVLDEGARQLRESGFQVTPHLAVGEPVEEICRLAGELRADLIIVGHEQKASWATRWWRGSVGKSLLDCAPCSVLISIHRD
jgi:nucleotide-binding universal stress UspA family protein